MQYQVESEHLDTPPIQWADKERLLTRPNKILIVDDDRSLCMGLHIRLRANYYETCFAHDAHSAITMALAEIPDLILLDICLPDDDGYTVLQQMRAFPALECIPVIVMSGRDRFTQERHALDAGACRFLPKPIDNLRLLSGIRTLLG